MQVNDTVRAVHTAGAIRRAFFATVLSVQPTLPEDIGTNGEPTVTLGFLDPTLLHMVGGIEFHKAFRRQTTVRHVSHDEVQQAATEYCWTDVLPNDGGHIILPNLNMSNIDAPAAVAAEPESTIGTIVYINHKNGLEVFQGSETKFLVDNHGEAHVFSDLFSAQAFVNAQPAPSIEGSPRDLLGHQMFGENSEEVARGRYEIHKKQEEGWDHTGITPQPSAADLDAVAAEQRAKEATETPGFQKVADDAAALHAAPEVPKELAIETKVYTDGTTATGVAPLPDQSPAQQDAAELPPETPDALAAL